MTVYELTAEQMDELKQNYLTQYLLEAEDRTPSYGELADAADIVSDHLIYEVYGATIFYNDDFFFVAPNNDRRKEMVNNGYMYVDIWHEYNKEPFEFDCAEFYEICKEYNDFLVDSMFRLVSMTPNERMPDYYHEMRLIAVRLRRYNILLNKLVNHGRMSGTDYAFMRSANGWEKRILRLNERNRYHETDTLHCPRL